MQYRLILSTFHIFYCQIQLVLEVLRTLILGIILLKNLLSGALILEMLIAQVLVLKIFILIVLLLSSTLKCICNLFKT